MLRCEIIIKYQNRTTWICCGLVNDHRYNWILELQLCNDGQFSEEEFVRQTIREYFIMDAPSVISTAFGSEDRRLPLGNIDDEGGGCEKDSPRKQWRSPIRVSRRY